MISHRVLTSLLILDLQIEFLKEENPSNQLRFGLFLGQEVLKYGMVRVDNDLAAQDIRPKLLQSKDYRQQLLLRSRVVKLSVGERLACVTYGSRLFVDSLPQNHAHCKIRSITHNLKR